MRSPWLFLTLAIVTTLVCARLGFWQLGRLADRRQANAVALSARTASAIVLPGPIFPAEGRRVTATGDFDLEHELVLRARANGGAPGVEIATPLRLAGHDTALIVIRGFVPSDDAMSVDLGAIRESGVRTIHGITFPIASEPDSGAPIARQGATTWRRLDLAALRKSLPYPVYPVALWQERDSGMTGMPIRIGAPALSDGPHLNYALQWFGFAVIFGIGGAVFSFRRPHPPTPSP